jgi:hypothetical protein
MAAAMSESDNQRKHDLECLRLAADCRQLASDVDNPALQLRFRRMAKVWTGLTEREPTPETEISFKIDGLTDHGVHFATGRAVPPQDFLFMRCGSAIPFLSKHGTCRRLVSQSATEICPST